MHLKDQDYDYINFLVGLLKMIHRFPHKLHTVVTEKYSRENHIQKRIWVVQKLPNQKQQKKLFYDYIFDISKESL